MRHSSFHSTLRASAAVAALLVVPRVVAAQSVSDSLFAKLAGRWSCEGGFPNGRALAADLTFGAAAGGRALTLEHMDRPPGTYWQRMTFAADAGSGRILGLGVAGSSTNHNAIAVTWTARTFDARTVEFDTDSTLASVSRYSYAIRADGALAYGWYRSVNGRFVLGDSLICRR